MLIYRLPRSLALDKPNSFCPGCRTPIGWRSNIPLLGFLIQGGRCAHCRERIHWRYPLSELLCAMLALAAWYVFGASPEAMAALLVCAALVALALIDLEHGLLPDRLTLGLLWAGLAYSLAPKSSAAGAPAALPFPGPGQAIAGAIAGYAFLWLFNRVWRILRKRDGLGLGDCKLLAAMGALAWTERTAAGDCAGCGRRRIERASHDCTGSRFAVPADALRSVPGGGRRVCALPGVRRGVAAGTGRRTGLVRSMKRRFTVGLTGGIASGKSLAADRLASLGAAVVDTDVISREQTAAGMPALAEIGRQFGADLIRGDGTLDRARLRKQVFADPAARKRLEAILHPRIREAAWGRAHRTPGSYLVMVVPLLVETGFTDGIDRVLVIDAPRELQMARLRDRDGFTRRQALAIFASQASRRQRRAMADDVILNDGSRRRLARKVDELHAGYLMQAKALNEH